MEMSINAFVNLINSAILKGIKITSVFCYLPLCNHVFILKGGYRNTVIESIQNAQMNHIIRAFSVMLPNKVVFLYTVKGTRLYKSVRINKV